LNAIYTILKDNASDRFDLVKKIDDMDIDQSLQEEITSYFTSDPLPHFDMHIEGEGKKGEKFLLADIRAFLDQYDSCTTGRQVARIFHGLSSPNVYPAPFFSYLTSPQFPADAWRGCKLYWRRYMHIPFSELMTFVTKEILRRRGM